MAAFQRFDDMGDLRLKPRLLQNLMSQHVPNEKQLLPINPVIFPKIRSTITTHKLLSDFPLESTDPKFVAKWKSAVDDWVDRLLALVSSNMVDKCQAGIYLLGITCRECSSDRFITSYSVWFNTLLSHIKNAGGSRIVRVASCISISDLLTRLSRFPHGKKDAVSHAAKVIQPIINILEEDSSEVLWEGAIHLLSTVVIFFPAAFHSNYDKVEAAIASKIFSAKTSPHMLKNFDHFLALLPKAKGDESSWSLMMQKLLISINVHLNNLFQGLEEETKGAKAIKLLVPPGKDSPPPLGGQNGVLDDATWNSEQLIVSKVSALMFCISKMLTSSYKAKVTPLLSLVERVLVVNGSLPRAMPPFMTGIQQELVCAELPTLHSSALDLLHATIKNIGRQLPQFGSVVRLVNNYFRRCALPELRIKLYSITKTLLIRVGASTQLAQEVVTNASTDLDPISVEGYDAITSKSPSLADGAVLQACSKKRKHSTKPGVDGQLLNSGLEVGFPNDNLSSPISLKIAALEALETLLTVGVLGPNTWREHVENLLMTTATNACDGRWENSEAENLLPHKSTESLVEFQLAALRAFLASLLSSSRVCPRFLTEGLELFRSGRFQGEKVAAFCAHALMSLRFLERRALPLDTLSSHSNGFPESNSLASQKHYTTNLNQFNSMANNSDDLCKRWVESADLPSNTEVERTADTMLPPRDNKKLKLGDNVARTESLSVQDHRDMVASKDDEEADADMVAVVGKVPELSEDSRGRGSASEKDAMAPIDVATRSKEGDEVGMKKSEMEEAALKISSGEERELLGESNSDSIPSLGEDDYLSSDSDIES